MAGATCTTTGSDPCCRHGPRAILPATWSQAAGLPALYRPSPSQAAPTCPGLQARDYARVNNLTWIPLVNVDPNYLHKATEHRPLSDPRYRDFTE